MFNILKYIQPTWYFNLAPNLDHSYFPSKEQLKTLVLQEYLDPDPAFEGAANELELAYRAHKMGFINLKNGEGVKWWMNDRVSLTEEYKFARKYFHKPRVIIALFLRILYFNNPILEIRAYLKSTGVKRFIYLKSGIKPEGYNDYNSNLIKSEPKVTIIIPTLNRYEYLKNVLLDLEVQDYTNFDVIVVDQSVPYQKDFYKDYKLSLKVLHQHEKALWLARNRAIRETDASFLLFYDDDSRVDKDWIRQHLKCIDYFNADISSGVSISIIGSEVPLNYRFFRWSDQLDTGNVMIRRDVFKTTGLFDRQFEKQRMGDGEFGLRAYLAGFKNVSNPLAKRLHLKVDKGGLRDLGNWDAFRPKSIWSPRPVPSVLYLYRKYFGVKSAIISLLTNIPPSIVPYQFKRNKRMLVAGSLLSFILMPLICVQVIRSWLRATSMLENPMIETLNEKS